MKTISTIFLLASIATFMAPANALGITGNGYWGMPGFTSDQFRTPGNINCVPRTFGCRPTTR